MLGIAFVALVYFLASHMDEEEAPVLSLPPAQTKELSEREFEWDFAPRLHVEHQALPQQSRA
jgi:hypothetical protein